MISRIIKVEVRVISLITLTETLIILDITKTVSNNIVLLYIERKEKINVATVNIHLQTWTLFC